MHEIELIKRARKKRDWEKLLPEGMDDESILKRNQIIQAIETDQWAFREQVIIILITINIVVSIEIYRKFKIFKIYE